MGNFFSGTDSSAEVIEPKSGERRDGEGTGESGKPLNTATVALIAQALAPTSTSAFQGSHGITINNGNLVVAGGNVSQDVNNFESSKPTLELVPPNNFRAIQSDTLKKRTPGTVIWFIASDEFQAWVKGDGGILWVTGMPGAGKTVLASLVIDYLEKIAMPSSDVSVAFVYCRYTESMSVEDILIAIIRQHLERHPLLAGIINPIFLRHHHENTTPSQPELLNLLKDITKQFKAVFYSLDALDESPDDLRFDLVETISSINAHFFITSRPLDLLKTSFPEAIFVEVEAHDDDMKLFIEHKIARNPAFRILLDKDGDREEIISKVIEKSHGMFLHASLQVEALRHCYTTTDLRRTMAHFPAEIKDMYIQTMQRVSGQLWKHACLAKLVLVWVLYTHRSLSLEELQLALAFDRTTQTFDLNNIAFETFLVSLCCGLVTVDKESRLVRLVHSTAKSALQPLLAPDHPDPHAIIAEACIACLVSCEFHDSKLQSVGDLEQAFAQNPLLSYAFDHWGHHVLQSDGPSNVRDRALDFIRMCKSFPFVHRFRSTKDEDRLDKLNQLHVAALYNFPEVLSNEESSSTTSLDVNSPTAERGLTALMLASFSGHLHALQTMLKIRDLQINSTNRVGWTALTIACYRNHLGVVRSLLNAGIDVQSLDNDGRSAFMVACHKGHKGIVQFLLTFAAIDVNQCKDDGWTALMLAASEGHEATVNLLLGIPNIQANAVSNHGWTALKLAAKHNYDVIRDRLLRVPGIQKNPDSGYKSRLIYNLDEDGEEEDSDDGGAAESGSYADYNGYALSSPESSPPSTPEITPPPSPRDDDLPRSASFERIRRSHRDDGPYTVIRGSSY